MKRIFVHEGSGYHVRSTVIVCSNSQNEALLLIREKLDEMGLIGEKPMITAEYDLENEDVQYLYYDDGDF